MKFYSLLILFLFWPLLQFAQQQDAIGSFAFQIEKKLNQTFSVSYYTQVGFNENITEYGYSLYDLGINIKLTDNFYAGYNYRIANIKSNDNKYLDRQMMYGDLGWVKSFGKFNLNIRTRYLNKWYGWNFDENNNYKDNAHYIRNKIQFKYALNYNYSIYTSLEQIYRLDLRNETEQLRYGAGINYQINTKNKLQLSYILSSEQNKAKPDTNYTTGLTYYFKF